MWVAVVFVVAAYGVHRAAHCVAAVKQRSRALDYFEPVQLRSVDHLSVISRLRRERACANAVFHHEHPITVETTADRTRTAGPKAAVGDARADSMIQRFSEGGGGCFRQLEGVEGLYVLERFEGSFVLCRRRDRDLAFFHRHRQQEV